MSLTKFLHFQLLSSCPRPSFRREFQPHKLIKMQHQPTKNLYSGLKRSASKGVIFGQQDALAYGLNADKSRWIGDESRSDVKTISGEHPALVGYDLGTS